VSLESLRTTDEPETNIQNIYIDVFLSKINNYVCELLHDASLSTTCIPFMVSLNASNM